MAKIVPDLKTSILNALEQAGRPLTRGEFWMYPHLGHSRNAQVAPMLASMIDEGIVKTSTARIYGGREATVYSLVAETGELSHARDSDQV